jgi:hypothetical protein
MSTRLVSWEHATPALRLRATAGLRHAPPSSRPFAVAPIPDAGFAIALCDATGSWSDLPDAVTVCAETMVEAMATSESDAASRLGEALRSADLAMCRAAARDRNDWRDAPSCSASLLFVQGCDAWVAWVGAVPLLLSRKRRAETKTRSQPLRLGGHGPSQPRSIHPEVAGPFRLTAGDRLILCYENFLDLEERLPAFVDGIDADAGVAALLERCHYAYPTAEMAAVVIAVDEEIRLR